MSADDSEHIAAEKMPATRYADTNGGRLFTMNVGRIASEDAKPPGPIGRSAVEREEADAEREEQRELQDHENARADERLLRVAQAAAREQPLDDQLVGAMGSHGEDSTTNDAGEQRVRFCKDSLKG